MATAIYLFCLAAGLLFAVVSAVAGHLFGGHDSDVAGSGGHAEAGVDGSDMPGVSVFSPTVIATFVTAFGGGGLTASQFEATRAPYLSAPIGVAFAFLVAGAVLVLLRQLFLHTQSSSESKVSSLVGQAASILTPIPENGVGEIAYVQAGTRYTAPARSEDGHALPSSCPVVICRVSGIQFFVTPQK